MTVDQDTRRFPDRLSPAERKKHNSDAFNYLRGLLNGRRKREISSVDGEQGIVLESDNYHYARGIVPFITVEILNNAVDAEIETEHYQIDENGLAGLRLYGDLKLRSGLSTNFRHNEEMDSYMSVRDTEKDLLDTEARRYKTAAEVVADFVRGQLEANSGE